MLRSPLIATVEDPISPERAARLRVTGTVQGVGFRPAVYRMAEEFGLSGWVQNAPDGVEIHVQGPSPAVDQFLSTLRTRAPRAARIARVEVVAAAVESVTGFRIARSKRASRPTARISPDLSACDDCLREIRTESDRHFRYPYVNCTQCGPRYSIILGLPYDRSRTTMSPWAMCADCARAYEDPGDRRFHAQPTACARCGPRYRLCDPSGKTLVTGPDAFVEAASRLLGGDVIGIKGIGGYHLSCDARNARAVSAVRHRKFRKEQPFALMARDLAAVRSVVELSETAADMISAVERPIVLMPALECLPGVAPGCDELGIMLPYAPLHALLFDAGAPPLLAMTSANRSSEPIEYEDDSAFRRLSELADGFLAGERPIARRVDDSVTRIGPFGPMILRRSRGFAPGLTATLPEGRPILAMGADLKNAVTLVVDGQAYTSQHIGDLEHYAALASLRETVRDLLHMYDVSEDDLVVVHDAHPQYHSTQVAHEFAAERVVVQHHRAHAASVLAERGAWNETVVALVLDGSGFGDDGSIWGGEVLAGSLTSGFERVAHLREAPLPGGDAAARHPVQAAAGFLSELADVPPMTAPPFHFPNRYVGAMELIAKKTRLFQTTSAGRLFDAAAALLGFVRPITYEGQAAVWLEQMAARSDVETAYSFPGLDYRPLLAAVLEDRMRGTCLPSIARRFHIGLARGLAEATVAACRQYDARAVALSGGVFQNVLLLERFGAELARTWPSTDLRLPEIWINHRVPSNDGGISLGQAAMAAFPGDRLGKNAARAASG